MRTLMPMLMILLKVGFTSAQGTFRTAEVTILPASELSITGDTNINTFACDFNVSFTEEVKEIDYSHNDSQIKFNGAILKLHTAGFDCGSKAINKDFHTLIQSEAYPEILLEVTTVRLLSLSKGIANVCITIAGIEKFYSLSVDITKRDAVHFKGTLALNINDFGLEPPKKLFGMIQVKNEIKINFDLRVQD